MSQAIETPLIDVPADVRADAIEKGLDGYLPGVLAAAGHAFPTAEIRLYLKADYFDPELRYIVVVFGKLRTSIEEALAREQEYYRSILACVPAPLAIYLTQDLESADDPPL